MHPPTISLLYDEEMQTQDGLATADPVFTVDERYSEPINTACEDPDIYQLLNDEGDVVGEWESFFEAPDDAIGFVYRWRCVSSHFTRRAAQAWIYHHAHDYDDLRIFVASANSWPEIKAVRHLLLNG